MPQLKDFKSNLSENSSPIHPVAVIDIGTSSIRLLVAQAAPDGCIKKLDFLHQSVSLGKDTFTKGIIAKTSMEECVQAVKSFQKSMFEYGITDDRYFRAVATTAVREASNIDAFIDRVSIATGINIEPIDEAEVARLTYQSYRFAQNLYPELSKLKDVIILEVGGGSTELLYIEDGLVSYYNTYRIGTMRMREMLHEFHASPEQFANIITNHIDQYVTNISKSITLKRKPHLFLLGSEIRFAASKLGFKLDSDRCSILPVKGLSTLSGKIILLSPSEIVRKYSLSLPDAETIGQALIFYSKMAESFKADKIRIADISMANGLILELSGYNQWNEDFLKHIESSAIEIARKYKADEKHARHVSFLCNILFDSLNKEHRLETRWKHLLIVAALLHDIGTFVSNRSHHKHSMYLIQNCELFGLSRKDILLVSLIARYHRRSSPKPDHQEFNVLSRSDRQAVMKTASILRTADALDRSFSQRIREISCSIDDQRFIITTHSDADLSLEQLAIKNKGPMFEDVYGLIVTLRPAK